MGLLNTVGTKLARLFGAGRAPAPNTQPNGGDGVQAYGGYLVSNERNPHLIGARKWTTYANATNTSIVATGLRYSLGLIAGTTWHAEPNERGGAEAERAVDVVTQGLLNAQMARPWSAIVRKAALYKFSGFSLHEWTVKRRDDGMVVFADISHRPQYTIDRWNKPDERGSWDAISQLTNAGNSWVIPRNRLFYCVDDTLTDLPDGVGLFRHIVELVRRLDVLEGLELMAYQTDLRGMPIGRAPIADMRREAEGIAGIGSDKVKTDQFIADRTRKFVESLAAHAKTPEQLQYLLLDSGTYRGAGSPDAITSIQKWAFELLRGDGKGTEEVAAAIGRLQFEIARVMGIEFAMMGAGGGSLAMHDDKTSMLALNLQTTLTEVADFATNDLARVLTALNGMDPETCTPRLVAEPISTDAIEGVCRSLSLLAGAGLAPNDEAWNVLRKRMRLPPMPEPMPEEMGMLGSAPDPTQGEEDVPIDDLGESGAQPASNDIELDPLLKIGPPPRKPFAIPHIPGPPKAGASAGAGHGSGTFDESKHPRDKGKFSHTEGAQGEHPVPREGDGGGGDIGDAGPADVEHPDDAALKKIGHELLAAHATAAKWIAALNARFYAIDDGEHDIDSVNELPENFDATNESLGHASSHAEETADYELHPLLEKEEPDEPEKPDGPDESLGEFKEDPRATPEENASDREAHQREVDYHQSEADQYERDRTHYKDWHAAMERHEAEIKVYADRTQTALEDLYGKQRAALQRISKLKFDEEEPGNLSPEDARDQLKDQIKATEKALKRLVRITRRTSEVLPAPKPKLAPKPKKKKDSE